MDPRIFSGIIWILLALFMIGDGLWEYLKKGHQEALLYIFVGLLILLYQLWLYRRTGKIGGPL